MATSTSRSRPARAPRSSKRRSSSKTKPITREDLLDLKFLEGGAISPDGKLCVFPVKTARKDRKGYDTHLHGAAVDGSWVRQFTFGKRSDGSPVFSPDGAMVAFVGKRGHHPGIHLLPMNGGEARPLVEKDGAFTDVSFSPDGKTIVCAFRPNDPPPGAEEKKNATGKGDADATRAEDDETPPKREAPIYRHIDRLWYRLDGSGFLPRERFQIWLFDLETGVGTQLTKGKRDCMQPSFSPDGRSIAYVTNMRPDPDLQTWWTDIFVIGVKGGKARRIETPPGMAFHPRFSPDGRTIAWLGHDDIENPWFEQSRVWTVSATGRGGAICLCPDFDQPAYDATISDAGEAFFELPPTWTPDGNWIYFNSCRHGSSHLYRIPSGGGVPARVTADGQQLVHVVLARDCRRAVGVVTNATTPAEIHAFDLPSGKQTAITRLNREWTSRIDIQKPREVWVSSTEGTKVQAWILTPPGFSTRRKYPAIVEVHGGPQAQYGHAFFHEMQLLAAQGYVVYYSNPRGSQGYGRAFAEAIKNDWGNRDFADVTAGTDYLAALPYVDAKRIGITGGSYGGYMTNWAVGHTTRYKAAVTQRSVVDLVPFFGSSDFGFDFHNTFGGHPWENLEGYRRQSPLTYAKNIRTPLLIIHSENDLRCNIEQAENLFATLKVLRRKVELIRFPEESHGLSRIGRPDRRLARLEKIVEWFGRYL